MTAIIGWVHSPFSKLVDQTVESLIVQVTNDAIADAGLSAMQFAEKPPAGVQVRRPELAGIFNMGGAAVANYVSVLERSR